MKPYRSRDPASGWLLVKAQVDAVSYFTARGFTDLPINDQLRDYLTASGW